MRHIPPPLPRSFSTRSQARSTVSAPIECRGSPHPQLCTARDLALGRCCSAPPAGSDPVRHGSRPARRRARTDRLQALLTTSAPAHFVWGAGRNPAEPDVNQPARSSTVHRPEPVAALATIDRPARASQLSHAPDSAGYLSWPRTNIGQMVSGLFGRGHIDPHPVRVPINRHVSGVEARLCHIEARPDVRHRHGVDNARGL
jgi:hypothetical protein